MRTFTLDTNCIVSIDESRVDAAAIRALANAHADGTARLAVIAISASERQRDGQQLRSFAIFKDRLAALDFAHLEVLRPMAYADICYFDWSLLTDDAMEHLEGTHSRVGCSFANNDDGYISNGGAL
jgi:hypothetical protein